MATEGGTERICATCGEHLPTGRSVCPSCKSFYRVPASADAPIPPPPPPRAPTPRGPGAPPGPIAMPRSSAFTAPARPAAPATSSARLIAIGVTAVGAVLALVIGSYLVLVGDGDDEASGTAARRADATTTTAAADAAWKAVVDEPTGIRWEMPSTPTRRDDPRTTPMGTTIDARYYTIETPVRVTGIIIIDVGAAADAMSPTAWLEGAVGTTGSVMSPTRTVTFMGLPAARATFSRTGTAVLLSGEAVGTRVGTHLVMVLDYRQDGRPPNPAEVERLLASFRAP